MFKATVPKGSSSGRLLWLKMKILAGIKSSRLLWRRVTSSSLKWYLYLAFYRFLPEWDCPHALAQEAKGIKRKLKPPTSV